LSRCAGIFDVENKKDRIEELTRMSGEGSFWDDPKNAQVFMRERTDLIDAVASLESMERRAGDVGELTEMAQMESDESILAELLVQLEEVERDADRSEFQRMMTEANDRSGAVVQINPGAGGTDSCDWAQMLVRMYTRWAEDHNYKVDLIDVLPHEEAGIKSCILGISGPWAHGFLKAENGVHRLVRISPFDAAKRRHTAFASVFVVPEEDDTIEVDIVESDLRIDTYRASGAGGQHVNRTDSAIRITHLPSGIVVQCQAERSQHKNKAKAMKVLAARLADLERKRRNAERDELEAAKKGINFGSQIRSYVLAPYRMVKDHRTGFESGNTDAVLDGDLDRFIRSYLLKDHKT
jgi:peptide chain release factor 2